MNPQHSLVEPPADSPFPIDEIESIVRRARRKRLETEGYTPADVQKIRDGDYFDEPPLIGDCIKNAIVLCNALHDHYFNPILVWGALNFDDNPPATVQEARKNRETHFWVELEHDNETLILELASEAPNTIGEYTIRTELPDTYHRLPGSRFYYTADAGITAPVLRSENGYKLLKQHLDQP